MVDSEDNLPGFGPFLCHLPSAWLWASYLSSLLLFSTLGEQCKLPCWNDCRQCVEPLRGSPSTLLFPVWTKNGSCTSSIRKEEAQEGPSAHSSEYSEAGHGSQVQKHLHRWDWGFGVTWTWSDQVTAETQKSVTKKKKKYFTSKFGFCYFPYQFRLQFPKYRELQIDGFQLAYMNEVKGP